MNKRNYLGYDSIDPDNLYSHRRRPFGNDNDLQINPFNSLHSSFKSLGESKLAHNPILNPVPNYEYNKYFNMRFNTEKEKKTHCKIKI